MDLYGCILQHEAVLCNKYNYINLSVNYIGMLISYCIIKHFFPLIIISIKLISFK